MGEWTRERHDGAVNRTKTAELGPVGGDRDIADMLAEIERGWDEIEKLTARAQNAEQEAAGERARAEGYRAEVTRLSGIVVAHEEQHRAMVACETELRTAAQKIDAENASLRAEAVKFTAPVDVEAEVSRLTSGIMQAAEPPGVAIPTWIHGTVQKLESAKAWARGERAARRELAAVVLEQRAEIDRLTAPVDVEAELEQEAEAARDRWLGVDNDMVKPWAECTNQAEWRAAVRPLVEQRARLQREVERLARVKDRLADERDHEHAEVLQLRTEIARLKSAPGEALCSCGSGKSRSVCDGRPAAAEQTAPRPALIEEEARQIERLCDAADAGTPPSALVELPGRIRSILRASRGDIPAEVRAGEHGVDDAELHACIDCGAARGPHDWSKHPAEERDAAPEMAVTTGEEQREPTSGEDALDLLGRIVTAYRLQDGSLGALIESAEEALGVEPPPDSVDPRDLPPRSWRPKPGDRVRTVDPLTATDYRPDAGKHRRSATSGALAYEHDDGGWWVRHDDGTEAPYDTDELGHYPAESEEPSKAPRVATCVRCPNRFFYATGGMRLPGAPCPNEDGGVLVLDEPRLCVAALVTDPAARVLLVFHRERETWEMPGGKVEDEAPLAAICRETQEEAGIDIVCDDETVMVGGTKVFRGHGQGKPVPNDPTGFIVYAAWWAAADVLNLATRGALSDLPSRDVLIAWARGRVGNAPPPSVIGDVLRRTLDKLPNGPGGDQ